ncbi:MAG: ABC transporter permease [Tissierellia bacterium]|nr:ABC transporter permease [Tissierellia bacterium]
MVKYIVRRLIDLIPTIFLVAAVVFVITRMVPGDPASAMLGPQASVEEVEKLREQLGLNEPLITQFISYIKGLLQLDLGRSLAYNEDVFTLIMTRFPNTVVLAVSALIVSLLIGVPLGIISATKKGSIMDLVFTTISLLGVSLPVFWLGIMLVLLFSVTLGWLPATGMGELKDGIIPFLKHLVLPTITLATIPMANFARIIRASMLDVMEQNYIRTARAKGVKRFWVIMKHAFKNAFTPLLTVIGMQVANLLSGAVLTETIFSWPGLGRLIVDSIEKRDYIVVQGTVLFIAVLYVLINLAVDLLYTVVNPRVSLGGSGGKS